MRRRTAIALLVGTVACALTLSGSASAAKRTLTEYRYFRALSLDLVGRAPTRAEVSAFERDEFDIDKFVDEHLSGEAYAERVRRIYMDLLRLEVGPAFNFTPRASTLRRHRITGPDGKPIDVYYRAAQRRAREETDGAFCLTFAETGLKFPATAVATGTPKAVTQAVLDANTVKVRPWWLYRDYKSKTPIDRYGTAWATTAPGFIPVDTLLKEPDGSPTVEVRVCKEEASVGSTGKVFVTGRKALPAGTPPPYDRLIALPLDSAYAVANAGKPIACSSDTSIFVTNDCGCGHGLERCMPGSSTGNDPLAFSIARRAPLGIEDALDVTPQTQGAYSRSWWPQEAAQILDRIVSEDRDFREVLTGKWSMVNGPLTQFYRSLAPATCCGNGVLFGYVQPVPLFDPAKLPDLMPHATSTWKVVEDRGPQAAGLLTTTAFLTKFATRRGRANAVYNAFLCREFVAADVKLPVSKETNLMLRPGCNTCHAKLEPLSAYFTRIQESDWTYLPAASFPAQNKACAAGTAGMPGMCRTHYDPEKATAAAGFLRGAYASVANADAGPTALAIDVTKSPEFAPCVAQHVATSFLGRPLSSEDATLHGKLAETFVASGFKMRALVKALVHADAYRVANNLSSTVWREGGGM